MSPAPVLPAPAAAAKKKHTVARSRPTATPPQFGSLQWQNTPIGQARRDYREQYAGGVQLMPEKTLPGFAIDRAQADLEGFTGGSLPGSVESSLDNQVFKFKCVRPDFPEDVWLDSYITQISWLDEGELNFTNGPYGMTGSMTVTQPDPSTRGVGGKVIVQPDGKAQSSDQVEIHIGHVIECYVRWGNAGAPSEGGIEEPGFIKLWDMVLDTCNGIDIASGVATWTLQDKGSFIYARSQDAFNFTVSKRRHRHGWRAHDMVQDVAQQYKIPLGHIAEGNTFVVKKTKTFKSPTSPLQVIAWAYAQEFILTGRPYIMRWIDGKLNIYEARRNPLLYIFRDLITQSAFHWARSPFSSITVSGSITRKKAKGHKTKPITVRVTDKKLVKEYGFIHTDAKFGVKNGEIGGYKDVTSRADARKRAKMMLKHLAEATPIIEFTHPGIALVRRGDAIEIDLPEEGFSGIQRGGTGIYFVTRVEHSLDANGSYAMAITGGYRDALDPVNVAAERDAAVRNETTIARGDNAQRPGKGAATTPGSKAKIDAQGNAIAPADAPQAVQDVIAAANQIHTKPYVYGGGHGGFSVAAAYDCSSSTSFALHGGGLLSKVMNSGEFKSYGQAGAGQWITIYASDGHVFMIVAGIEWDTSHSHAAAVPGGSGPRWVPEGHGKNGFVARHPPGL